MADSEHKRVKYETDEANGALDLIAMLAQVASPQPTPPQLTTQSTLPPVPPSVAAVTDPLAALRNRVPPLQAALATLANELRAALDAPLFQHLNVRLADTRAVAQDLRNDTRALLDRVLLEPMQYEEWKTIGASADELLLRLEVYRKELKAVFHNKWPKNGIGMLVILRQPYPAVVKQNEKRRPKKSGNSIDEVVEVKLLTGARAALTVKSVVSAEMIMDAPALAATKKSAKQPGKSTIIDGAVPMGRNGVAMFDQLRFSKGTGVQSVSLQFTCECDAAQELTPGMPTSSFTLESNLSEPLIVMTNESQFSDSAGKLLETQAFAEGPDVKIPWLRLANLLQLHYLMCTRQPLHSVVRPLSRSDLNHIWQSHFGGASLVSRDSFLRFWAWFGVILHKIRHQKPVRIMWEAGLLFGLISRQVANQVLTGQPPCTFLVRFSEGNAGHFALAYVDLQGRVKHTLIPEPTKKMPAKLMPDFLKSVPGLVRVAVCKTDFLVDSGTNMVAGFSQKGAAFGKFYTVTTGAVIRDGYDDLAME